MTTDDPPASIPVGSEVVAPSEMEADPTPPIVGPRDVAVLPIRHTVLFPFAILPLNVGRKKNVQLLGDVMSGDRTLAVFTQRNHDQEEPAHEDLHPIGTLAVVLRMVRLPDERVSILVQGSARIRLEAPLAREPYLTARVAPIAEIETKDVETEALAATLIQEFERIVALSPGLPVEAVIAAKNQGSPGRLADFLASLLEIVPQEKQRLLEMVNVKNRLQALHALLAHQGGRRVAGADRGAEAEDRGGADAAGGTARGGPRAGASDPHPRAGAGIYRVAHLSRVALRHAVGHRHQ